MAARPEKHLIMQAKRLHFQIQLPTGDFWECSHRFNAGKESYQGNEPGN